MTYEQIVKQLINGNHLNEEELKQAMALRDILNALLVGRVKEYTKELVEKDGVHTINLQRKGNSKMKFTYEDKIRANDLAFDYKEQLIGVTADRIREDDELMNRIDAFCRIELAELVGCSPTLTMYEDKFTLKQLVDLKVDELAEEAVSRIRIYATFDIEVENI